ncbi:MAG: hypothetical protein M3Q55_07030 [Acidobacteriota bacterium]|nr:hypothetical protein [Acidobacteriota bacterium]
MQALIAILLGILPHRCWPALEDRFPIYRMAWLSGTVTMLAGIAVGMTWFLTYAWEVASRTNQAYINAHGDLGLLPGAGLTVLPAFLLTTPAGLLSLYLTASGFLRAVGAFLADDTRGDFILTALDGAVRGRVTRTRTARRHAAREQRCGPRPARERRAGRTARSGAGAPRLAREGGVGAGRVSGRG